jgi:hypothetical protein
VRYILTPKGAAEKTRLTYEYIQYSLFFFKEARKKLKTIFTLFEKEGVQRIAFYGAGELAEIAYISLQGSEMPLVAVFDEKRDGKYFFGQRIMAIDELPHATFDKILVTTTADADRTVSIIVRAGVPEGKIALIE